MANRERGEVEVEIGGKTLVLRFDYGALAELETAIGATNDADLLVKIMSSIPATLEALYIGAKVLDPKVKRDDFRRLSGDIKEARNRLRDAVMLAFGVDEASAEEADEGSGKGAGSPGSGETPSS